MTPGPRHHARNPRDLPATVLASSLRVLALVLLPLLVLNLLLGFGNHWPTLWPRLEWRFSAELAVLVVALAAWVGWRGRAGGRLLAGLSMLGTAWVVLHYINVTVPSIFGRRLNAYWDGQHLWAVLRMSGEGAAGGAYLRLALSLLLAMVAVGLLYAIVRLCLQGLAHAAEHTAPRRTLLGLGALGCALWAAQPWQGEVLRPLIAPPVSSLLAEQSRLLSLALSRSAHGEQLGPSPAFAGDVDALEGSDVLIVFAEAYGAVTLDKPDIAEPLAASRARLAAGIAASGRHVVSARLISPTFGGASWLAHGSLLAGIDTRDPGDYPLLLTTRRPTLVSHFAANGYHTVVWTPGIQRAWPEGAFYGFHRIADADRIGYLGPHFGFWRIPDQASMALIHHQEFGKRFPAREGPQQAGAGNAQDGAKGGAEDAADDAAVIAGEAAVRIRLATYHPDRARPSDADAASMAAAMAASVDASPASLAERIEAARASRERRPRLVVFPTVTTHAPFRAIAPFTDDWSRLLGHDAYSADELAAAEGVPVRWSDPTPAYLAAMRYQFDWLADYLGQHAPADLFTIIVGDHQPIGSVTGPGQPWDVPIHIVSHDRSLLARFEAAGFVPGLVPPDTPLGPMHDVTPLLIEAFRRGS